MFQPFMPRYIPIGIGYLAAVMDREGLTVRIIDEQVEDNTIEKIKEYTNGLTNPYIFGFSVLTASYKTALETAREVKNIYPNSIIVFGGPHPSALPEEVLTNHQVDIVVKGEGELILPELYRRLKSRRDYSDLKGISFRKGTEIIHNERSTEIIDLDTLPPFPYHMFDEKLGYDMGFIVSSRGCPFNCLSGDTIIDTTKGNFKIRDLIGTTPSVLTRDPKTKVPVYAKAKIVAKTGTNRQLVRITFKKGKHIDCTPDHKFIVFKNGNQSCETREYETEAGELQPGDSVRAIHYETTKQGYVDIVWGRHLRVRKHTEIMESMIDRDLMKGEHIHHIDHNKLNNVESNLILTNPKEHLSILHPELSQRMKENNPTKNMSMEWREHISTANQGKKRTLSQRMAYRNSKLGTKNPNYKHGLWANKPSRVPKLEVNHVVESVQYLEKLEDTYCMEVSGYNWFYANDVLVHNCIFCSNRVTTGKRYRYQSPESTVDELCALHERYHPVIVSFLDDNLLVNHKRVYRLIELIKEKGLHKKMKFNFQARGDNVTEQVLKDLYNAGFHSIFFGLETSSEEVMKVIRKGETVAECITAVKLAKSIGFHVSATFIYGLPTETHQNRMDCAVLANELKIDMVRFNNATPYPGTELYDIAKREGRLNIQGLYENFNSVSTFIENPFKTTPFSYVPDGTTEEEIRADIILSYFMFYLNFKKLKRMFARHDEGTDWFIMGSNPFEKLKKIPALSLISVYMLVKFLQMLKYTIKKSILQGV